MTRLLTIAFLICSFQTYSQKIEKRIGEYKALMEVFVKREKNKSKKTAKTEFYFNNSGRIIEKISYGRHHYATLKVIGEIEQYSYKNGLIDSSKSFTSYCKSCDYTKRYTVYSYKDNKLTNESSYDAESNSLFMSIDYTYHSNIEERKLNDSTTYQTVYDTKHRKLEYNQIYNNKLRWQYKFYYSDNCRTGNFQTFYCDGKENSEKGIICYDTKNRIISEETYSIYNTKILYTYSKEGFLESMEEYGSHGGKEYELESQTIIKIFGKKKNVSPDILTKINNEIIGR